MYLYVVIGVVALVLLTLLIIKIIKFVKMSPEQKREFLKTYVKGIVALAEQTVTEDKKTRNSSTRRY